MKKILFVIPFLIISGVAFAKEPSLAEVLDWKYGPVADTCQDNPNSKNPKMTICGWRTSDPLPTDDDIQQAVQEFKAAKQAEKVARKSRKQALKAKLSLSNDDIQALTEIVSDGNVE